MKICQRHGKLYLYIHIALVLMVIALFTTTLTAAEPSGNQPRSIKFELRLASHEKVEGWDKAPLPSGGNVWISPEADLNNADVLQASPEQTINGFSVSLLLTEDGTLKLARFTKSHANKFVAVMIDNRVITVPKIIAEITGGRMLITGDFNEGEAKSIAEGITMQ